MYENWLITISPQAWLNVNLLDVDFCLYWLISDKQYLCNILNVIRRSMTLQKKEQVNKQQASSWN